MFLVFSPLPVALLQFCSHSGAIPRLCCPGSVPGSAEGEMDSVPGALRTFPACAAAEHTRQQCSVPVPCFPQDVS